MSSNKEESIHDTVSEASIKEDQRIGDFKENFKQKKQWPVDWREQIELNFNPVKDHIPKLTREEKQIKKPNKEDL